MCSAIALGPHCGVDRGYYIVGQGAWVRPSPTQFDWWADQASAAGAIPLEFPAADIEDVLAADKVGSTR